jgi:methionyl-tRNA synthetase
VYLEEREPWRAIKSDRDVAALTLRTALGFARVAGVASCPYLPTTAEALAGILPDEPLGEAALCSDLAGTILSVTPGTRFAAPGLLFEKLDEDRLAEWADRFAGDEP